MGIPLHVLIVDDNRDHADSLAMLVDLWGHTATVAYDGESGLKAAIESMPNCLILDINMPRINGYTLAQAVRREAGLAGSKIMAVSAYSDAEHVRRTNEVGFDYRFTKPADTVELERTLNMIDHIVQLSEQTEKLAKRNIDIAERSEALVDETKGLLQEVKDDLKDMKADMQDIKEELREVKDRVDKATDGEEWKSAE